MLRGNFIKQPAGMLKEIFLPVSFINDIFQSTDVSHFAFHSFVFRKIAVQYYTGLYIEKLSIVGQIMGRHPLCWTF
jgi:hypothetical protein